MSSWKRALRDITISIAMACFSIAYAGDVPSIRWRYDEVSRPVEITVEGMGSFFLIYDRADRMTSITHPNGIVTRHAYDAASRVTDISHMRGGGTIARFQYKYDAHGNIIEHTEQNGAAPITTTFAYDGADRLIAIHAPGKYTRYTLDPNGNRVEATEGPSEAQVVKRYVSRFDQRNQIVDHREYDENKMLVSTTGFDYDANGNMIRVNKDASVTAFRYDALNRLLEITPPNGAAPTVFRYGPGDLPIAKIHDGQEVRYHYDGDRLILETNVLGNPMRHYAYSAIGLLSTSILGGVPQYRSAHLDAQGSPIAITAANGNVLNRSRFDPFGVETVLYGIRDQAISYQGYWTDAAMEATGSMLSAARQYIPGLGRFGERDPVEGTPSTPSTFNAYTMGQNNPHRWKDPTGRCSDLCAYAYIRDYQGQV